MGVITRFHREEKMSLKRHGRPANGHVIPNGGANDTGSMEAEVWGMVNTAQDVARQLTEMTLAVPDQAQEIITMIYISMNNTMLAALESAENMIKLAQDATKDGPFSPFINAGLEQLNIATVELANAMKRVSDLLEKLNREKQQEREKKKKEYESSRGKGYSRFS